jgi:hypothetical protein
MGFLVPTYTRMPQTFPVSTISGGIDFCYDAQPRDIMPSKQKPIGVLHIINGEHFSGAERVQQLLGKRLPDECVDPYFACLKQGKFQQNCGLDDGRVFIEPMRSRLDWRCISRITSLARELEVRHPSCSYATQRYGCKCGGQKTGFAMGVSRPFTDRTRFDSYA